jgi:hypothetical protein
MRPPPSGVAIGLGARGLLAVSGQSPYNVGCFSKTVVEIFVPGFNPTRPLFKSSKLTICSSSGSR